MEWHRLRPLTSRPLRLCCERGLLRRRSRAAAVRVGSIPMGLLDLRKGLRWLLPSPVPVGVGPQLATLPPVPRSQSIDDRCAALDPPAVLLKQSTQLCIARTRMQRDALLLVFRLTYNHSCFIVKPSVDGATGASVDCGSRQYGSGCHTASLSHDTCCAPCCHSASRWGTASVARLAAKTQLLASLQGVSHSRNSTADDMPTLQRLEAIVR